LRRDRNALGDWRNDDAAGIMPGPFRRWGRLRAVMAMSRRFLDLATPPCGPSRETLALDRPGGRIVAEKF